MDKKIAALIGVISAGASLDIAHAATVAASNAAEFLGAQSFEVEPIPNAGALLRAADASAAGAARTEPGSGRNQNVLVAQYYPDDPYYYDHDHPRHSYHPYDPCYHHHHHPRHSYHPYDPCYHHHHHNRGFGGQRNEHNGQNNDGEF